MKNVLEIVSYKLNKESDENLFIEAFQTIEIEILPKIKWFIWRKFLKGADWAMCDIVMWESIGDAKNAMDEIMSHDICVDMFSLINESTIKMNHYTILDCSSVNLDFNAWVVEIWITEINKSSEIWDVLDNAITVRNNYLEKCEWYIAQFCLLDEQWKYWEVVFNKNGIKESEAICNWYFDDKDCLKYISDFNADTTKITHWNII